MFLLAYLVVKAAAYTAWCYLGVKWFQSPARVRIPLAITLGLVRLAMGVVVGAFIYLAALSMNNATRNAPLTYAAIYVPVRIVEWSIWYFVIAGRRLNLRSVVWILGGVIVSCLADIPIGIAEHGVVPVGRPFC